MLDRKTYFVRERVGLFKLVDTFDIIAPETGTPIGIAREEPALLVRVLRFLVKKSLLPTVVRVYSGTNPEDDRNLLFSIQRGMNLFAATVRILDARGQAVGSFRSKVFSLGGAFRVFDSDGREVALVKGDWKGWNFRLTDQAGNEIGAITKKWGGIGRELLTSADQYVIDLHGQPSPALAMLLLAAGLAVDSVYRERR
jgi:uncharacterized protein YxjI